MALSQTQEQIVTGLLLGDGYLEFDKFKASRLQIKQAERKREYVFWLYTHFADKVRTPPKQRLDTRQWYFSTRSLRELEEWRDIFYPRGKKVVPRNIIDLLTDPITLAVWFMDDGKRRPDCRGFFFDTLSFTVNDQECLQKCLARNFALTETKLHWNGDGFHIYLSAHHADHFRRLIERYVIPSMKYKLP